MFQVGEYVIYGYEGVCRIVAIGHPKISALNPQKEYYCMEPVGRDGTIYAPFDTKTAMRSPESADTVSKILSTVPDAPSLPDDALHAGEFYRSILHEQNFLRCFGLYFALSRRKQTLNGLKKTLNTTDQRYFKQTEACLCSEIGFALRLSPADSLQRLQSSCMVT